MSSTPAVVHAAQASNDVNWGDHTFTETQKLCTKLSIAMEHTTTVTPQRKRVCARYGHKIATRKQSTPTVGKNTPTVTEIECKYAHIPDITPEKAIVTETERVCALVQAMLHYYEINLLEEET